MLTQLDKTIAADPVHAPAPVWMNLLAHLDGRFGGISAALPSLCEAVCGTGIARSELVPFCTPEETYQVHPSLAVHRLPFGFKTWLLESTHRDRLDHLVRSSAGVHIHGLWQEHCLFGAAAARRHGKPYLISAHGMLDRWALRARRWKKLVYSALIEQRNLAHASCLHALTEAEAVDYRRLGVRTPIAVIPNGVRVPGHIDRELFFESFPALRGKRIVLYLGRLHFKKGLDLLCRAWARADRPSDVHLVLAGPDFEGTEARLRAMVAGLEIGSSVSFTGMLDGAQKWSALSYADLFVLPSRSEGLSMSVLEALAMGVPALVTNECHVPEVAANGCGWSIAPEEHQLQLALREFFHSHPAERRQMGANGMRTVAETYTWTKVGQQMAALYAWLAGGSEPDGVHLHRH